MTACFFSNLCPLNLPGIWGHSLDHRAGSPLFPLSFTFFTLGLFSASCSWIYHFFTRFFLSWWWLWQWNILYSSQTRNTDQSHKIQHITRVWRPQLQCSFKKCKDFFVCLKEKRIKHKANLHYECPKSSNLSSSFVFPSLCCAFSHRQQSSHLLIVSWQVEMNEWKMRVQLSVCINWLLFLSSGTV